MDMTRYDKCNICGAIMPSDEVIDNKCPNCGSLDMDDVDNDPYEDDDLDDIWG